MSEETTIFLCVFFGLFGVAIIFAAIWGHLNPDAVKPPLTMHEKFVTMGEIVGKSKSEIIGVVGLPSGVSAVAGGKSLLQWMSTGYHIALLFNGEICEGITHQYAHRAS